MTARWSLWVALAFAALLLVGAGVVASPPEVGANGRDVAAFYGDHAGGVRLQAWLIMASSIPGGLLVGIVAARLGGARGIAFAVAGASTVALLAIGVLLRLGLARHADTIDPGTARALADVEAYWGPLLTLPICLQAGIVGLAGAGLPRWMAAISAVLAIEQLIESTTIFASTGFLAPGGDMNALVGPTFYVVWIVALGVACRAPD